MKYRVPTFDRKYKSCVPKSEPYSKMSGGRGKGGRNNNRSDKQWQRNSRVQTNEANDIRLYDKAITRLIDTTSSSEYYGLLN